MFKTKSSKRQMISVVISLAALMLVAQVIMRMPRPVDVGDWVVFEFAGEGFGGDYEILIETSADRITATLTNTGEEEFEVAAEVFLAKLTCEEVGEWRIMPFEEGVVFSDELTLLPPGFGASFPVTGEMLAGDFLAGHYRFVLSIVSQSKTAQVWAAFDLLEK